MRRIASILMLLMALALASCTSSWTVTQGAPAEESSSVNLMAGEPTRVEMANDAATTTEPAPEAKPATTEAQPKEFGEETRKNLAGENNGKQDEGTVPNGGTVPTLPIENGLRLSIRNAIDMALQQNLRLKQQWEAVGEAEARLREKQNDYGPRLQFDYMVWTWHGIFVTPVAPDPDIPVEGTGRAQMTLFLPVWVARQSRDAASRQAVEEVKVRKEDYSLKRSQVAAEVVKKFFDVLAADESLAQSREAVALNEERLKTLKVLEREGKVLKNKVLLGEKFLASAKEEAKFRASEREIAALRLRRALRVPDRQAVTLVRPAGMAPEPPTEAAAVERTKAESPLLRRLDHEKQSAWWTGRVRGYEEPRAHIALSYGASFPEYDRFTDDFATIGLSVNWPTAKCRLDRAKRDQARHKVNQLELEKQIVEEQLDLSVREAHAAYMKSLQRVEAKELGVALAEENLRLSRVYRERGQTDTQEPEDVFQTSVNAIALAEARMDLTKVRYETYSLMADLFERMYAVDELVWALVNPTPPNAEKPAK